MLYIQTANKLERTARWLEGFEGGVERLKSIILEDSLGICADLDSSMQQLIAGYQDEWTTVVKDESRRKQFRKFANTVGHLVGCPSDVELTWCRGGPHRKPNESQSVDRSVLLTGANSRHTSSR